MAHAAEISIFIPYTEIQPATLISLIGYTYTPVKVEGEYGYSYYFRDRWRSGKTFINLEHDIVVYPGALKALWDCPREWCVYDYHLPVHWERNLEHETRGIPLGCMKISAEMISKTKDLWDVPVPWSYCDFRLTGCGLNVHQHHPGVVNANPELLKLVGK
jgi:hypothetical protein